MGAVAKEQAIYQPGKVQENPKKIVPPKYDGLVGKKRKRMSKNSNHAFWPKSLHAVDSEGHSPSSDRTTPMPQTPTSMPDTADKEEQTFCSCHGPDYGTMIQCDNPNVSYYYILEIQKRRMG
jgi:hypothetical protein